MKDMMKESKKDMMKESKTRKVAQPTAQATALASLASKDGRIARMVRKLASATKYAAWDSCYEPFLYDALQDLMEVAGCTEAASAVDRIKQRYNAVYEKGYRAGIRATRTLTQTYDCVDE